MSRRECVRTATHEPRLRQRVGNEMFALCANSPGFARSAYPIRNLISLL